MFYLFYLQVLAVPFDDYIRFNLMDLLSSLFKIYLYILFHFYFVAILVFTLVERNCFSGLAFPPLYFYNGGVREFLTTVKQHGFLVRLVLLVLSSI